MSLEKYEDFLCPYCGQTNQLIFDMTGGSRQELVVDCEICCAPIAISLKLRGEEVVSMDVRRENE